MFTVFRVARRLNLDRILFLGRPSSAFLEYFRGFENVDAVKGIFGERTEEVLRNLKVDFIWAGYMGVNSSNGHLMVNSNYLNSGDKTDIYLDVIHELVHVRQHMQGKELFDSHYGYVDRPTEIEAYKYAVAEARRLGLKEDRICLYLKTEWMRETDLKRLAHTVGVNCPQ
jgi:hypothetical protein